MAELSATFDRITMWSYQAEQFALRQFLADEASRLPLHERRAVWLQTENGMAYLDLEEEDSGPIPHSVDDIVQYMLDDYVLPAAAEYSNTRIRKCLYGDVEW